MVDEIENYSLKEMKKTKNYFAVQKHSNTSSYCIIHTAKMTFTCNGLKKCPLQLIEFILVTSKMRVTRIYKILRNA